MMKRRLTIFYFCLIVASFSLPFLVLASDNPLDSLFAPMKGVNIVELYEPNHYWLDFFIFLFFFIPIAKLTIGRRFDGRDGNILSAVIGVILSLSLSLVEARIGFIASLGPIAAGIFVFIVGMVIFSLIRHVGAGNTAAGSLAFVVTYFLLRATVPNFFLWLEENSWTAWLHFILVIAIIISISKLFISILRKYNI